jgi:hypothetical protein
MRLFHIAMKCPPIYFGYSSDAIIASSRQIPTDKAETPATKMALRPDTVGNRDLERLRRGDQIVTNIGAEEIVDRIDPSGRCA